MHPSLLQVFLIVLTGILLVVLLTTKLKWHAFFALIAVGIMVGWGLGLSFYEILDLIKESFGRIIGSLALIIIFGITLGLILEKTGATWTLANALTKAVGKSRIPEAMNITGWIIGMPIFCDSGYIVLSSLNNFLTKQTRSSIALMGTALATGLYAVHNLIPPHPGPSSAVIMLEIDFGRVILYGLIVAIPTAICGLIWARFASKRLISSLGYAERRMEKEPDSSYDSFKALPPLFLSVLPIIIPIVLIGVGAFVGLESEAILPLRILKFLGIPEVALLIGILLALLNNKTYGSDFGSLFSEAVEKSGNILLIIGAGGAFGAIIATANLAELISDQEDITRFGLFLPFALAAVLKTAQGSSTVAAITAATIVLPLLPMLGLNTDLGRIFSTLAIGSGSIMISHANDSYFWVISKFSNISMKAMLRVYSLATAVMGIAAFGMVELLYMLLR